MTTSDTDGLTASDTDDPTADDPDNLTASDAEDQSPFACPYCDRRERTEHLRALHVGEEHWEMATAAERDQFRDAYETESVALRRFRLLALGMLVLLYFGFLFIYAVVA